MTVHVSSGYLHGDVPYLKIGQGPPLVSVLGLSADHTVPTGIERRMALKAVEPLSRHFTVWIVNEKRGLRSGESMAEIAGHLGAAIEHDIGGPVFLHGVSTGGSVALQLALDRPDLVRRLVLASAAHRLNSRGRALELEMARLIRGGRPREAWGSLITFGLPRGIRRPALALATLAMGGAVPDNPTDLLVVLEAESVFDVEADLHRVSAPTLVAGGSEDAFYSEELFRRTAAGIPDGRAHVFRGWGHGRASVSPATANLALGFMLAGTPDG